MYRLSTVVLRLAAAIGFSRVQGSTTGSLAAATTTGSLAAATEAHGSPGSGRVQGSTTGTLAAASSAQGRTTGYRRATTDTQQFLALLLTLQKHREEGRTTGLGRVRASTAEGSTGAYFLY